MAIVSPSARATVCALAAVLAGCSSVGLSSDRIEYRTTERQRPLEVPPDLTPLRGTERFTVPGQATASAAAQRAGQPTEATVAPGAPNARIERSGSYRWLAVDVSPEQAFMVTREFWRSVGLAIERDDPAAGILETVWAENRANLPQDLIRRTIGRVLDGLYSTGEQDKFRARIERTARNTAEIYISHRGMVEVYVNQARDTTRWQPRPNDPELEAEMLTRLLARFTEGQRPAATATAAAAPASTPAAPAGVAAPGAAAAAARLVGATATAAARVEIDDNFDRAWRRVGLALDRGGFTVEERDRINRTYVVRFLDPEEETRQRQQQGFFSRMLGVERKLEAQQYRVVLNDGGTRTDVTVLERDGKPSTAPSAQRILTLLAEQLR